MLNMSICQTDKLIDNQIDKISIKKIEQPCKSESSVIPTIPIESNLIYFKIITLDGDTWTGVFEVDDITEAIQDTFETSLSTSAVGGLNNEPGFVFTSSNNIFVWQGDNSPPSASSTIYSTELVTIVNNGNNWQSLYGQTLNLFDDGNSTTDLSALNPGFERVFGKGGTIQFSNSPL
jgi:hypothetical protein